MKLSKKSEAEVMQVYNAYWENYLKGDVEAMIPLLDDGYTQVGSAETEVFFNKKDAVQFLYDTIDQVAGKLEMRNRSTKLELQDTLILLHELCDVYVLTDKEWNFYSKFRASTLMQKKEMGWKIIHQHSSMPDIRTQEGENIAIEKISKENLELREAVKRRTIELEQKNHELEIEGSLERVRAQALGMKKPEDLPGICEILFEELRKLGFNELRNAMINIHDEEHNSFLNYDYSDTIGRSITHLFYNTHPLVEKQIKQIRSSRDAFSETSFSGNELDEWKAFRKSRGEKDDPRLENISSLDYYFYSIGSGSIGISTFGPIKEEKINVLKRFRNVFDFAYRRYMDVAQAEAQAYEAKLEASLERIRAQAMSMSKADELAVVGKIIYSELKTLGFSHLRNTEIILNNDQKEAVLSYYCDYGVTGTIEVFYKANPIVQRWVEDLKKAPNTFVAVEIPENEMDAWRTFRESIGYLPDPQLNAAKTIYYYSYSIGHGALSISSFIAISDDQIRTLERFKNVFELAYRRFVDVTQAEAQAREAQIELSLERVRARTMAMRHSEELQDAAIILFEQMKGLGVHTGSCGFNIWDQKEQSSAVWMSSAEGGLQEPFTMPHTESAIYKQVYESMKEGKDFLVIEVGGKNLKKHFDYLHKLPGIGDVIKKLRASGYQFPETMVFHFAFFAQGYLSFHLHDHHPETHELLKRFAKVFEQTYTRFLDLQKAEAQAREARIEAALEKVRGRAMAMHNSNDLSATASIVFSELRTLGIHPIRSGVGLFTKDYHRVLLYAATSSSESDALALAGPFDMSVNPCLKMSYESCIRKENYFPVLSGEELKAYYKDLAGQISVPSLSEEQFRHEQYGYYFPFSEGYFYAWTETAYSEDEINILNRFKSIIDLTFRRYLDLQKAEAQAREAQIEAALEKVRSRTMGMQKSDELKEVIQVVYDQFIKLNIKIEHTGFVIDYKARNDYNIWIADPLGVPSEVTIPYFDSVYYNQFNEAKENGIDFFATNLTFEEKNRFYQKLFEYIPGLPEEAKKFYFSCPGLAASTVLLENVGLYMENFSGIPYSDEENATLMRFGKVFQQTYTRFLDLQKAEEQARAAQIELAVERVRAKALAMHNSTQILDVVATLRNEMLGLEIPGVVAATIYLKEEGDYIRMWDLTSVIEMEDGFHVALDVKFKLEETDPGLFIRKVWNNDEQYFVEKQEEKDMAITIEWLRQYYPEQAESVEQFFKTNPLKYLLHPTIQLAHGKMSVDILDTQPPAEMESIMIKMGTAFDLAYKRFVDLQKSEKQIREAKVELALERVRARTMAMQKSDELSETVYILFQQFRELGENPDQATIGIIHEEDHVIEYWVTMYGKQEKNVFNFSIDEPQVTKKIYHAWREKNKTLVIDLSGNDLLEFMTYRASKGGAAVNPNEKRRVINVAFFSKGLLNVQSNESRSAESIKLLERFAVVFEQTYTRFLDLQKAEAQAREANIETALERVRSRTMAMQRSIELGDVATILFKGLNQLVDNLWTCGFVLCEKDRAEDEWWLCAEGGFIPAFYLPNVGDATHENIYHGWLNGEAYHTEQLEGKSLKEHYDWLKSFEVSRKIFDEMVAAGFSLPIWQKLHCAYFSKGYLCIITQVPCPEEHIFKRFAQAFDQTYTRFLDLQKAEAQAREAKIETSLERIRARGLAMHKSEELVDASTVLFNELNTLGIETIRTGVGIVDSLNETIEVWSSELVNKKENKILGVVPAKAHPFFEGYYTAWKKKQPYFLMNFADEEVREFYSTISSFLSYPERESFNPNESISVFFFSEGSLNVVSLNPLTENECQLMNRFARVFGLIYTRFLDLKKAEAQAREAQIEVALERVRSRTLAMHKSDEMAETAAILFKQLCDLEVAPNRLYIFIFNDETSDFESWITEEDGKEVSRMFKANIGQSPVFGKMYDGWKAQKKSITIDLQGKELADYIHLLSEELHAPVTIGHSQKRRVQSAAYFSQGLIGMASPEPQPEETLDLMEKFAGVFNLTYTRFNDLQVAEANAKNAQVEEQKLREEKKRSDSLLLNILPEEIANELKQFGKSYARKHEEVTILFADIKGFSSIAENLSAEALVNQLDECFRAFDNIVEKHGLEKIKTVGDAYVCACGLPKPVPDNAIKTVQAAIDMLDFLKGFGISKKIQNLPAFEFRVGIHTGPVVTGVVGLKKFTYDIWGDAVNMAARMEQHGEAGKINVSGSTYQFIKDKFTCTHRGKIEAKNKGEVDMYFVDQIK